MKKECDSKTVYKKWYLKAKIKSHSDGITDFHDKKNLMMNSNHISLAVLSLDSALKKEGNYHLQVFLKGYRSIEKRAIINELESSNDSDKE